MRLRFLSLACGRSSSIRSDPRRKCPERWKPHTQELGALLGFVLVGRRAPLCDCGSCRWRAAAAPPSDLILEGNALSGGNLTLKNWALSLDSFWLVDVPLYAIAVLVAGVRPQLLHPI